MNKKFRETVSSCVETYLLQKSTILTDTIVNTLFEEANIKDTAFYRNHSELGILLQIFREAVSLYTEMQSVSEQDFRDFIDAKISSEIGKLAGGISIDFINLLALEKYEKNEAAGYYISLLPNKNELSHCKAKLEFDEINQSSLRMENVHAIRKQLNIAQDTALAITLSQKTGEFITIGVISRDDSQRYLGFKFCQNAKWEFLLPDKSGNKLTSRVVMNGGFFAFPSVKIGAEIKAYLRKKTTLSEDQNTKVAEIVNTVESCKHGALLIFGPQAFVDGQRKRLVDNHLRGMKAPSGLFLHKNPSGNTLQQLAAIDGALLISTDGECVAYGVILDGHTSTKGNQTRGSRYNCAGTFINDFAKDIDDVFAVVCSEDGMVDFVFKSEEKNDFIL